MKQYTNCFDLRGRLALVTGASRGIGRRIATGLAEAGADIVCVARSTEALADTQREVQAIGRQCHAFTADVSVVESVNTLFDELGSQSLLPDILLNNAGMEKVLASLEVSESTWDRIIDTNLKGAFFVAQGFARPLLSAGRQGSIINMGSLTSAVGIPTAVPYTSSKSGILGITRALASEWAAQGIRVNAIGPGYFRTEMTEAFYQDDNWQQQMLGKVPMGRFGDLDDLVGVSVFLASAASAYMTGQILYVDGGYLASI